MIQNNFSVSSIMNNGEFGGGDSISRDNCVIGRGVGDRMTGTDLPKLALDGIDGRGGCNRSGEPVPIFNDSF